MATGAYQTKLTRTIEPPRSVGAVCCSRLAKRALDLVVASLGLVLLGPLVLLAAAVVKLVSPGPAFFTQERVGQFGVTFRVIKLRTMRTDAAERLTELLAHDAQARAEWNRYCKLRNDPRVIPWVGHFLRRTSIDELPQLWNILCGTMSVVGPRPFPRYHTDMFPESFVSLRCSVKPGLTGLWQVQCRSDGDIADQKNLDEYYIRNWSLWLDLCILMRTFKIVLKGSGAC